MYSVEPLVGRQGIVHKHLRKEGLRQAGGNRVGSLEVPVRVVGRKQQHFVGTDFIDDGLSLGLFGWVVERLDREPHVVADDLGRGSVQPWRLGANAAPSLVDTPEISR